MAETMKVGVVTVTYNSAAVIEPFLRDTFAQSHDNLLLYVIDNASGDDTLARVRTNADPRLRVIANDRNVGVAEGNNQGIRAALADGCEAVLLINNDTEFEPGLVAKLVAHMRESGARLALPKMLFFDPPDMIWCAGGSFNRLRGYSVTHRGEYEADRGQYDHPGTVEYAPTCCLLVHREVFDRIGVMDERYFAYFDDADFCIRATRAGLELHYVPQAVLRHKVSSLTGGGASPFGAYYFTRNRFLFLKKHIGRMTAVLFAAPYQAYLLLRLISFKDGMKLFLAKQKGMFAGLMGVR